MAIDAGETWKAVNNLQISRADSITSSQLILLGAKLKADYIIAGLITDYREGDIEFKQHRLELIGKVYDAETGQLEKMDKVKIKCKKELQATTGRPYYAINKEAKICFTNLRLFSIMIFQVFHLIFPHEGFRI